MARPEFEGVHSRVVQHVSARLSGAKRSFIQRSYAKRSTSTRTVAKAKFSFVKTRAGKVSKIGIQKVKDAAQYYAHRPDEKGVRQYRAGFSAEHDHLTKHEIARFLEEQAKKPEAVYAYRLVLSPGANMDEEQLKDWARSTLARQGIPQYIAFSHAGQGAHTEHAHVHVMFFRPDKLTIDDFKALRVMGDEEADKQLKFEHELHRHFEQQSKQEHTTQFEISH
jgi:hypothetical protein